MTQEDRELLIKDLCARLPYGTMCYNSETESNFKLCDVADIDSGYPTFDYGYGQLETVKPYLRLMSSMTKDEIAEFKWLNDQCDNMPTFEYVPVENYRIYDWMNRHHIDYRGLIKKGLAIEVTEENNPYK